MGDDWDDDEWDDDNIEEKLAAQSKAKAKRPEDSEDEDDDPPPTATPSASAKPKAESKPKKAAAKKEEEPTNLTAAELKALNKKRQEKQNDMIADDLFSGFTVKDTAEEARAAKEAADAKKAAKAKIVEIDAFDQVSLNVQEDVTRLVEASINKVNQGTAKGAAVSFLRDLLKQLADDISFKELEGFEKLISEIAKEKKAAKGAATDGKANKANTKLSKTTKFDQKNEWEEVYGGGEGDEDWTAEEWAEWEKQEAAKWEAWEKSQKK
jgi:hypothetical protein